MNDVSVIKCDSYDFEEVKAAIYEAVDAVDGFALIKKGTKVAIKANLVSSATPDTATTTHPVILSALSELLIERGAEVIIGDSPGDLYNANSLEKVYRNTGLYMCEEYGAKLNRDFSEANAVFEEARSCKTFTYTAYLDDADVIINACKLKTHGMMGLSCAAKNIFGVIPGTMKPEYHFRYPSYEAFADMIVDLDEYFKPCLSICDAVFGMEGNGPTRGTPRKIGCVLASKSPHCLDAVAAGIIGLTFESVPTLAAAVNRGLVTDDISKLNIYGKIQDFYISDYDNIATKSSLLFKGRSNSVLGGIFGSVAKLALSSKPKLKKSACIGCGKCAEICPAGAIKIENKKAVISREQCIKCFCCQEFCPVGAMKVHRTFLARFLERGERKNKAKK